MPTFDYKDVRVSFPDQAVGLSVSKLLSNIGSSHIQVSPGAEGQLFSLRSSNYVFELEIHNGAVRFRRNDFVASKEMGTVRKYCQTLCSWKPDKFQLALMIDGDVGGPDACVTVETPEIFVPVELYRWAREFNLVSRSTYGSAEEFLSVLTECLQQAQKKIYSSNSFTLFWDYQKSGGTDNRRIPKREPEAVAGIDALLRDQSLLLSFELSREVGAGAGSLDMKATAPLKTGELVNIAIEAKNAHSGDIEDGIRFQLPEYMKSTSSTFGIYLVLWYKCEEFEEPQASSTELIWGLTKIRPYQTIAVELFDLSLPIPPSKLGRQST